MNRLPKSLQAAEEEEQIERFRLLCKLTNDRLNSMTSQESDRMLQTRLSQAREPLTETRAIRLIFEYGLDFIRQSGDIWTLVTAGDEIRISPKRVLRECGFRPVIAWTADRDSRTRAYVLPLDFDLNQMDIAPVCLSQIYTDEGPPLIPSHEILYYVTALTYRLRSLAVQYVWASRQLHFDKRNGAVYHSAQEVAYEVEACMTSAIRLIEALRRPFRKRFGVPNTLSEQAGWKDVLENALVKPTDLIQRIEAAWTDSETGIETLNEYRNVIEHREPISGRMPFSEVVPLRGVGTGSSLWIPDDPFKSGPTEFTYERRKDALTYCWKTAAAVIGIAREVFKAVGEYPSPYPYPDEIE